MLTKQEQDLFKAITNNYLEPLKTWLAAGGSPDAQNENGKSIIELLAIQHNLEGIKILSPYNPDISVKRNNIGEYSENIYSLVKDGNKELKNFVELEIGFYEEDFDMAKGALSMYPSQQPNARLARKYENPAYKQIAEFGKLKLESLNKYNDSALLNHVNKLKHFSEFIKCNPYFNNQHKLFETKINEYSNILISESFEKFEDSTNLLGL